MSPFQRSQVDLLARRLAESPQRLIALFGPRQTGKTTIVHQARQIIEQHSRYLSVDEPDSPTSLVSSRPFPGQVTTAPQVRNADWLTQHWEEARREAETSSNGFVLVLDEIQKVPNWSDTVKGL